MDNSQTLELQIKSKTQEAKASVENLVKSLTNVENVLTNIYLELGSIEKKADSSINKTTTTATKNVNQLKQSTDKATNSTNKLGSALKNVLTFASVKKLTTTLLAGINEAVDYTEQLNLFNVVFDNAEKDGKQMFSELGKEALQFQYKLNEAFGTNKTQALYMQGIFESMGETVGVEDKYSAIMSETMTKLTYDLASLYNKTESATAEAIRAGVYAGQTKPLRSYGIDVTQSSLQPIAESLGITESVKNMSQAEKEILRYIATLKQAKIAMGDLANTIESPSNQVKVFRQQLVEAKVALSSLFIGTFAKILPYANAILMVIKEISKAIATMFGIELKDYNAGITSQEGIYDGIADSAGDASNAVKELKRQTLGFDEIHNIDENKNSSSGSTSVSGGIDQRLLDAIQGYDNGMEKVKMKATEIRDKWMEILGFTKHTNSETGEIYFTLDNTDSTLYKVIKSLKDIVKYGKKAISGVFNVIKNDFDNGIFGNAIVFVFDSIKNAVKFISEHESVQWLMAKTLETVIGIKVALGIIKGFGIITGINSLSKSLGILNGTTSTIIGTKGALGVGASGLLGIYGILLLVATTWTISLICEGADAINKSIQATSNNLSDMSNNSAEAIRKLVELAKNGDTSSESFNRLSNYLLNNIERNKQLSQSISATKEQQEGYNNINYNTLNAMQQLYQKGYITKDMFVKFADAVNGTNGKMSNLNPTLQDGTQEFYNLKDSIQTTKNGIDNLTNSITGSAVGGLAGDLTNAGNSAKNSESKIRELQDTINRTTGKQITLDIDANTTKLKNKLTNTINSAFGLAGFGIVGGGSRANGGVYSSGSWKNIQQYANGGSPSHGTMFVAGEAGAEIVGHINGKTEVLNQSQIASSIFNAVYSAMSHFNGGGVAEINVHADKSVIVETAINGINQQYNQTGVCPIKI